MNVQGSQLLPRDGRSADPNMQCSNDLKMWMGCRRLAVGQREPDMPDCSLWAAEQLLAVQLQEARDHLGLVGLHSVHQQAPQNGHLQPKVPSTLRTQQRQEQAKASACPSDNYAVQLKKQAQATRSA